MVKLSFLTNKKDYIQFWQLEFVQRIYNFSIGQVSFHWIFLINEMKWKKGGKFTDHSGRTIQTSSFTWNSCSKLFVFGSLRRESSWRPWQGQLGCAMWSLHTPLYSSSDRYIPKLNILADFDTNIIEITLLYAKTINFMLIFIASITTFKKKKIVAHR